MQSFDEHLIINNIKFLTSLFVDLKDKFILYHQEDFSYLNNWKSKYSFITTPSEWKLLYSLINKNIVEATNYNDFIITLHLDTNSSDVYDLLTLPIPYVHDLRIYTDQWNEITKKILTQNRIKAISYLNLYCDRVDNEYAEFEEWMDGFIESAQKTTKKIYLYHWKMESNSLSKLFSSLNQTHSEITVELGKHRLMRKGLYLNQTKNRYLKLE